MLLEVKNLGPQRCLWDLQFDKIPMRRLRLHRRKKLIGVNQKLWQVQLLKSLLPRLHSASLSSSETVPIYI
ncbi:hypothetical protein JEQ12_004813 [Ovis aries]|uniref:Uncharacterized protein n=1 Tax=Ovis aries TaxID=9940 RepID=A0A836CV89_SHEEP|nr:hypothetical protein JEQ12_004813 [Ovis aries]